MSTSNVHGHHQKWTFCFFTSNSLWWDGCNFFI